MMGAVVPTSSPLRHVDDLHLASQFWGTKNSTEKSISVTLKHPGLSTFPDLSKFQISQDLSHTVTLLVNESKFRVNSLILALHSSVFEELIYSGIEELRIDKTLELPNMESVIQQTLLFLYGKEITVNQALFELFFGFAYVYKIEALERTCQQQFKALVLDGKSFLDSFERFIVLDTDWSKELVILLFSIDLEGTTILADIKATPLRSVELCQAAVESLIALGKLLWFLRHNECLTISQFSELKFLSKFLSSTEPDTESVKQFCIQIAKDSLKLAQAPSSMTTTTTPASNSTKSPLLATASTISTSEISATDRSASSNGVKEWFTRPKASSTGRAAITSSNRPSVALQSSAVAPSLVNITRSLGAVTPHSKFDSPQDLIDGINRGVCTRKDARDFFFNSKCWDNIEYNNLEQYLNLRNPCVHFSTAKDPYLLLLFIDHFFLWVCRSSIRLIDDDFQRVLCFPHKLLPEQVIYDMKSVMASMGYLHEKVFAKMCSTELFVAVIKLNKKRMIGDLYNYGCFEQAFNIDCKLCGVVHRSLVTVILGDTRYTSKVTVSDYHQRKHIVKFSYLINSTDECNYEDERWISIVGNSRDEVIASLVKKRTYLYLNLVLESR